MAASLLILAALSTTGWSLSTAERECLSHERAPLEHPQSKVVRVSSQHPAYLHCKVFDSNRDSVAWSRASDNALLTSGTFSFTSDPRFQVSKRSAEDWVLIIRRTTINDTGCYLCEVNSSPHSVIFPIFLHVYELTTPAPHTRADEGKLMANVEGSEVVLNCTLRVEAEEGDVVWMRNGQMLDLNDTHKYVLKTKRSAGIVVHTVRIRDASKNDDGHYSCFVHDGTQNASQIVHINTNAEPYMAANLASSSIGLLLISIMLIYPVYLQ